MLTLMIPVLTFQSSFQNKFSCYFKLYDFIINCHICKEAPDKSSKTHLGLLPSVTKYNGYNSVGG